MFLVKLFDTFSNQELQPDSFAHFHQDHQDNSDSQSVALDVIEMRPNAERHYLVLCQHGCMTFSNCHSLFRPPAFFVCFTKSFSDAYYIVKKFFYNSIAAKKYTVKLTLTIQ